MHDRCVFWLQAYAHVLGLHSYVLRAIPLFVVYLATLMHVYALARQQVTSIATGSDQHLCKSVHEPACHMGNGGWASFRLVT